MLNLLKAVKRPTSMVCAHFENKFHKNSRIIIIWLLQDAICCSCWYNFRLTNWLIPDLISSLKNAHFIIFFPKLMSKKEPQVKWSEMENFRFKRWFFQIFKSRLCIMICFCSSSYWKRAPRNKREANFCLSPMKPIGQ